MEENKTPNKSEKEIIKENMLILYKAYRKQLIRFRHQVLSHVLR